MYQWARPEALNYSFVWSIARALFDHRSQAITNAPTCRRDMSLHSRARNRIEQFLHQPQIFAGLEQSSPVFPAGMVALARWRVGRSHNCTVRGLSAWVHRYPISWVPNKILVRIITCRACGIVINANRIMAHCFSTRLKPSLAFSFALCIWRRPRAAGTN